MGSRYFRKSSYIQTTMNKYHSDIGSRLSGAYLPTIPAKDKNDSLEDTFCMLTIDTRHRNRLKDNPRAPTVRVSSSKQDRTMGDSNVRSTTSQNRTLAKSNVGPTSGITEEQKTFQCWKVSLRKKLTQVLIQKRHTCCRCKRRTRNCVRNKTFNGIEKHFTCCSCREASKAVHNLFAGQSSFVQSGFTYSSLRGLSQENTHIAKQKLVDASNKDSGYGTVTSCSTVVSSSSVSTTPGNSSCRVNKSSGVANYAVQSNPNLGSRTKATSTMCQPSVEYNKQSPQSCVLSTSDDITISCVDSNNDIIKSCVPPKQDINVFCADSNSDIIRSCALSKRDLLISCADSNNDVIKSCFPSRRDVTANCSDSSKNYKSCTKTTNDGILSCSLSPSNTRNGAPPNLPISQTKLVSKTTGVGNILVTGQRNCPFGVIRQINQRRIDEYDGYLQEETTDKLLYLDGRDQLRPNAKVLQASVQNDRCNPMNKSPGSAKNPGPGSRTCHTCGAMLSTVFFRLPWEGGFVCEDCLDRLH